MNKHAMANEYKILCSEANKMSRKENRGEMTSNGWKVVDNQYDRRSNFKAVLYEKDGQYALCFVGTDRFSAKDWGANAKMALTGDSKQIELAQKFTKNMFDKHEQLNLENTQSIGHSEGGTEATVVGIQYGLKTTTFNAYGAGGDYVDKNKNYDDLVTNYRDPHDPISKLKENVGTTYITPNTQNWFMSTTPFGSVQSHGIDNMGDCMQSVPVNEYKKSHPLFINKISEADITRGDIANMDSDLFKIYESEIDNRMANNRIGDLRQENTPNPFGNFGRESFDEAGGLIGNNNYPQFKQMFTREDIAGMSSDEFIKNQDAIMNQARTYGIPERRQTSKTSGSKAAPEKSGSSSSKSSNNSSDEGKWVTINGNHVLIKD